MTAAAPLDPPELGAAEFAGGFSRRAVGWIVGIAGASFTTAVLLTAFGEGLGRPPTPDANTFSESALGHRGLVELLGSLGLGVTSRQARAGAGIGPQRPLVLAEPDPAWLRDDPTRRLAALREEARGAGAPLVLVLPKWRGTPLAGRPGWVGGAALLPTGEVGQVLAALGDPALAATEVRRDGSAGGCRASWAGAPPFSVELAPAQLLASGGGLEPVVACRGGLLVARSSPAGGPELFLVADPDLLNNHGLGRADHAALVHGLLVWRLGAEGVVFDETIHGFVREPGLLAEALRFPLVLAVCQALVLAGTVLWAGMGRFGKPLPAVRGLAPGKQVLIDNTAELLAWSGHAAQGVAGYYRQTVRAVAAHASLPADLPEPELVSHLDRLARSRGSTIDLAALAAGIRDLPADESGAERALAIARRLYDFRLEMMDGYRKNP